MHFKSSYVKFYLWFCIIIPYLVLLALHLAWTNVTLAKDFETDRDSVDKGLQSAIVVLCIWFLLIEYIKARFGFYLPYFTKPWNIMNLVPMILILINVYWHDENPKETWDEAKG